MPKANDIIKQLYAVLPQLTDLFTDEISITSLTRSGTTVTAVTASVHGLNSGDFVNILGAFSPIEISSLTRDGDIATAITNQSHDLTQGFTETVEIDGADQTDYNGTKTLFAVDSRTQFAFEVSGSPITPATGAIFLLENFSEGYNGRHEITVLDTTSFTYEITQTPLSPAQGTIIMRKGVRVSGGVNIERIIDSYTKQNANDLWAFVVLGNTVASKNRATLSDATSTPFARGEDTRQRVIDNFAIFTIIPTRDEISGLEARDLAEDILPILLKSVGGVKFSSGLCSGDAFITIFDSHNTFLYQGSYYVHQFNFQIVKDITTDDLVEPDFNVAFRDISIQYLDFTDDGDEVIMTSEIELDN